MRAWKLIILGLLLSQSLFAQEQLTLRLNEQGILKILAMGIKYNTGKTDSKTFIVPDDVYKLTIKKEQIFSNPIVPILNEISNLDLDQDLDFYLKTSDIWTNGRVDFKSLRVSISNSHEHGFDIKLKIDLPVVLAAANQIHICEGIIPKTKVCTDGLKSTFTKLRVETKENPVSLSIVMRVSTQGRLAKLKVISVESNLEKENGPVLDIALESVNVPRMSIVINGQEAELDTSRLRAEILKRKDYLGKKLLSFVADFIANDVAEMLNKYLMNKSVKTSWDVFRKTHAVSFNEFAKNEYEYMASQTKHSKPEISKNDDPMKVMLSQISEIITKAEMNLSLESIETHVRKDIELSGIIGLMLNNKLLQVRNTLGNTNKVLPKLFLNSERDNDINIAISEPLINGTLDLVNSTGLFRELVKKFSGEPGFSVNSVKLHFTSDNSFTVVVNSQIDLKSTKVEGFGDVVKQIIASHLERKNNNAVINFPLEVNVNANFVNNGSGLELYVRSPFNSKGLINTFNYPSNVSVMTEVVRSGMLEKLKLSLEQFTNQSYKVDLSKFLNQSGVKFKPKKIAVKRNAYLLLNLDIEDIDFDVLKKAGE